MYFLAENGELTEMGVIRLQLQEDMEFLEEYLTE